jgi:hypothetical protein
VRKLKKKLTGQSAAFGIGRGNFLAKSGVIIGASLSKPSWLFSKQLAAESIAGDEAQARIDSPMQPLNLSSGLESAREKLLLDFGWTFHLGHACGIPKA